MWVSTNALPYFYTLGATSSPSACALLNASGYGGVGVLEPIRDRGTCLDAFQSAASPSSAWNPQTFSDFPADVNCTGCFFNDDKLYFCDDTGALGYEGAKLDASKMTLVSGQWTVRALPVRALHVSLAATAVAAAAKPATAAHLAHRPPHHRPARRHPHRHPCHHHPRHRHLRRPAPVCRLPFPASHPSGPESPSTTPRPPPPPPPPVPSPPASVAASTPTIATPTTASPTQPSTLAPAQPTTTLAPSPRARPRAAPSAPFAPARGARGHAGHCGLPRRNRHPTASTIYDHDPLNDPNGLATTKRLHSQV